MQIVAIDPGNEHSAVVVYNSTHRLVVSSDILPNQELLDRMHLYSALSHTLVIERVACMGMAVGESVFETVFWSGRFAQAWVKTIGNEFHRVKRGEVKMHLCGSMRAKDGNIRQALIDKMGAPGTKKNPGKTYGISKDLWAALAVAVTFSERISPPSPQS